MTTGIAHGARRRGRWTRTAAALVVCLLGVSAALRAQQAEPRFLAKEQIILYGIGLQAEPAHQVVPRDIATIVSTFLQAPTLPDGLPAFAPDAEVRATLRGPSFAEPQELIVRPNTPFTIPPLTVAGIHTLENIRLISKGEVLLHGVPESVVIEVIDKLLVTQVTARALTAAEIREKGIVFDRSSFQAYNFTAAFAIENRQVTIDFPVVLPQIQSVAPPAVQLASIPEIDTLQLPNLKTLIPDTLKLQTQIPNLSVVGFTLKVPTLKGLDLFVPPIPGVIVIPGDIGFLNQFFSVNLIVGNVAPPGSNLVVTDLTAEIVLPIGNDLVAGTGDDPLRMAHTASGESPRRKLVVQAGLDGKLGTADDILTLGPGETGNAEFLVEGVREGSHVVEMEMTGTLLGLPVGPVEIRGRAAGSVLVRNPTFSLTFTHPEIVSAGEPYTLDVTVTNTSASPANLVSVNLYPRNISGATIVGSNTRDIETILAGDSATVSFDLISSITGKVTATTFDSGENVTGRFVLKTAVGELGIPLSPDSLVLPKESNGLPKALRDAAIGLLGKAWAVATAPAAALPKDVARFSKQIVIDRAVEVAEAGFRVSLHEPVGDSAAQLAIDFMGSRYAQLPEKNPRPEDLQFAQGNYSGFDSLRRTSVRGDRFADAVSAVLAADLTAKGAAAFHADLASRWSYRPIHLSALVAGANGAPVPYRLSILDAQGRRVGGTDGNGKTTKQIPFSDLLTFTLSGGARGAEMAVLAAPDAGVYRVRLDRIDGMDDGTPYVLSLVVPDATGGLRQLTFQAAAGQTIPVAPPSSDPFQVQVEVYDGLATASSGPAIAPDASPVVDPPPTIIGAMQQLDADQLRCDPAKPGIPVGRVIALLFSEELTPEAVQDRVKSDAITNYHIDNNQVVSVALQPGGRIVFLALRDPYGPFVPRPLTVSNVTDNRGQPMPETSVPIEATIGNAGGVVNGRVMHADGTPVPFADVRLFYLMDCGEEPQWIGISAKTADGDGKYSWDFVSNQFPDRIVAIDAATGESRSVQFSVQRGGQRLNVDIVFLGRGTFKGRTLAENGSVLGGTSIKVTSLTDNTSYGAITDGTGRFEIGRIPVGNLLVEAVNVEARAQFFFSESIPFAGAVTARDITLLDVPKRDITIKTGNVQGFVYRPDGVTPIPDAPVIAYYQTRSQLEVPCPPVGSPPIEPAECAVAVTTSQRDGSFSLEKVTAGELRLYAFDNASLSQGNAHVALPADALRFANVLLVGGLGTVTGRVVDPGGVPVPGARVGGGFSLVITDAQGAFTLPDVPVGRRDIVAVSDALATSATVTVDIAREGEVVGITLVLEPVGSVAGRVTRADGTTPVTGRPVYVFRMKNSQDGPQVQVFGTAITDTNGTYRIDRLPMGSYSVSSFDGDFGDGNIGKVVLKFHHQVFRGDITYRGGGGVVRGAVFDDDGRTPLKARLGLSGDQVVVAGGQVGVAFQYIQNYRIVDTDFTTGAYSFGGLWVGAFTLRAVGQFSPDPIAVEGRISVPNEIVDLNLTLQPTSKISGIVYQPDGVTPVGQDVVIRYKSEAFKVFCSENNFGEETCVTIPQGIQALNAVTDEHGKFFFPIVNPGSFRLTAEDPVTGKSAQVSGTVKAGETADLSMRLLGIADLTVQVFGSDTTTPIANAKVDVEQLAYPKQTKTLIAGPNGVVMFAGGDAFSEGDFVVTATDQSSGFSGRAPGKIVKDGQAVTVKVYLYNATGTVFGTVFQQDGLTPAPNVDVVLSNGQGPLAFSITGPDGTYRLTGIPLGRFAVDFFEAATARRTSATGDIPLPGQEVPANGTLASLGIVKGTLLAGGTLETLKGWEITLTQRASSGVALPTLKTTTAVDGTWSFPGTSRGTFTATATSRAVSGQTSADGTIEREGQVVEVPLIVNSLRPLSGRVEGTVFNPDGTRAANAIVDICFAGRCGGETLPPSVTADTQGAYFLDAIPLGRFSIAARSQTTRDAGKRYADMELDGDIVTADVALVGVTTISGVVIHPDGSPATAAIVKLDGSPATGCEGPCIQGVKPGDGTFDFVDVPARTFTISAQDQVTGLRGAVGGTLNAGEHKTVTVVLEPTGVVSGRVLRASGQPAGGVVAELVLAAQPERRLYLETRADGTFSFDSAPIAAFTLNLQDPAGSGLAQRVGTVSAQVTLGDILLDEAPPSVASIVPPTAAVGVPLNQVVRATFTEPILPGTVDAAHFVLEGSNGPVAALINVSEGDTVATLTPLSPLKDETRFSVRVEGVKDRVGKPMPARYTSAFMTVDITPPSFVSVGPSPNANGVPIYTPVRIQFTEPIDPAKFRGPPLTLTGPLGAIAGRLDYILGNTVLVFTPNLPLAEASVYRVVMSAAADATGNYQPQDLDYAFSTTDRTPPQIAALTDAHNGTVIENTIATVTADVGTSHDVAIVDWYLNDVFAFAGRSAPFIFSFKANPELGSPGSQIKVSAIATDTSGNRGASAVSLPITVTADQPPVVSILAPGGAATARNGDLVEVRVSATDDVGLSQIAYKAGTGQPQDAATRHLDPAVTPRTETFTFHVPAEAVPGSSMLIEASGVDSAGHVVQAAPVSITVVDAVNPVVTITGTTTGAKVNPGQTTSAIVSVEDLGGVTSITFTVGGATSFTQTRTIDPAQNAVAASFTIQVPANAQPGQSLTLDAFAIDRAGNRGNAPRVILPVADTVAPTVRLTSATGSLELVKGQPFTVNADAEDEIALARVELSGQGAFTLSDAKPVSPPLGSAHVPFTFTVPDTLDPGAILTLRATAVDISGNVSAPALLTLSVKALTGITLPTSAIVIAGETIPVVVTLSDPAPAGGLRVDFSSSNTAIATVSATVQFAAGEMQRAVQVAGVSGGSATLRAAVQGVQRASMTVTVRGGIVRGTVFNASLQPVSGAQLTINSQVTATTNPSGEYFAEGVTGPSVTVKGIDPATGHRGFASASMNRVNGYATVNVILVPAGAIAGDVKTAAGALASAGVQVQLFSSSDQSSPLQLAFTTDQGHYEFPVVLPGSYVLVASSLDGHRGRATVTVGTNGDEETVPIAFIGEGTVVGTVRDGSGTAVPRASLTFQSFNAAFGSAPAISVAAEADGTFRFERVLIGSFTVQAHDAVTNQGGSTSGTISANAQTVTADVQLSTFGHVTGVVRRPDGATVAVGATVTIAGRQTVTNDLGAYTLSFLPLGPFTVSVLDAGTRQMGRASGTLVTQGDTVTVNVTLHPQGSLIVTVKSATGQTVAGASVSASASDAGLSDSLSGVTGADGTVLLQRLLSGAVNVSASSGVLHGTAFTTLAPDEAKPVTVTLESTGSIAGVVYEPDGLTPALGARVSTTGRLVTTGPDGSYRFDGLPLTTSYSVFVTDAQGQLRAKTKLPLALPVAPEVRIQNFTMVGLGSVTGRVLNPDASSAQNLAVTIRSFNADFGGIRSATTNAGGFYTVTNIPVGAVTVSAGDLSRLLLGEGTGTIAAHGDTATVDILLVSNAVTPPIVHYDANNYLFDIQRDGTLLNGSSAFRGLGGLLLDLKTQGVPHVFAGSTIATIENGGRELAVRELGLAGLNVTRKIAVPASGYFARYLDILSNPSSEPVTVDVVVRNQLRHTQVVTTSSGDTVLDTGADAADRWVVVDDGADSENGTPATAFVFDGAGGARALTSAAATFVQGAGLDLTLERQTVTVPANGSVAFLYFVSQQTSRLSAQAAADRLVQLPPEALDGLSTDEIAMIANFAVPADGSSPLAALPSLLGTVDGRALAADVTSAVASSLVRFHSANALFGRTFTTTTTADGHFAFTGSLNTSGSSTAIPVDAFTLRADHPQVGAQIQTPVADGVFADGETAAHTDVVFGNTGILRGTVRFNGIPAGGASVTATGTFGTSTVHLSTTTAGDGTYRFLVAPTGTVTLNANATQQGTNASASVTATVSAGQTTTADPAIDTLPPQVTIVSPAAGTAVDPRTPLEVTVSLSDPGGVFAIGFSVSGSVVRSETRNGAGAASRTETFVVPFQQTLPLGGSITLTVTATDAAGNTATRVSTFTVSDVVPAAVIAVVPADGAVDIEPAAAVALTFSEPLDPASVDAASVRLVRDQTPVAAVVSLSANQRVVTLTPVQPLTYGALHTVVVDTAVRDTAGNPMAQPFTSTFTIRPPDLTAPRVAAIAPAANAVDVPMGTFIQVAFTEPIDPATVTAVSVSVASGGNPIAGSLAVLNGNREVRFTPAQALPIAAAVTTTITSAITDASGNALADANGNPLAAPLTFTFTTATFGITRPGRGETVVERRALAIEARGSASLGITLMVFSVNGSPIATVGPPFTALYDVPAAAVAPSLTIAASARNSAGTEVAHDEVTVSVVTGLRMEPALFGIPLGGSAGLRIGLSSPIATDLPITLTAGNPAVATVPAQPVVLPAGQVEMIVPIAGAAAGNTTIIGTSERGTAAVIAAVSAPVAKTINVLAPIPGVSVLSMLVVGRVFAGPQAQTTVSVPLLSTPAASAQTVVVTSSDTSIARVDAPIVIAAGEKSAAVTIVAGAAGSATLTFRVGGEVRQLSIVVGTPPAGVLPLIFARSAGVLVYPSSSTIGHVFTAPSGRQTVTATLLKSSTATPTTVTVSSSNPAIATAGPSLTIPAGQQSATFDIVTGAAGTATLTFQSAGNVRQLSVTVGTPAAGEIPLTFARPAGVLLYPASSVGRVITAASGRQTLTATLLSAPAAAATTVAVSSSNPAIATTASTLTIAAGQQTPTFDIFTGAAGTATLTFKNGVDVRQLTVTVGTPSAGDVPLTFARPLGLQLFSGSIVGTLFTPPTGQRTIEAALLPANAADATAVTVTSSDPNVANVTGPLTIPAGARSVTFTVATGTDGVATLTFRAAGEVRQLVVVVGTPPAGRLPTIVAPIVGIQVKP